MPSHRPRYELLVAPAESPGVLIEPPATHVIALARQAIGSRTDGASVLDQSISEMRLTLARRFGWTRPIIATGHQAEFVHAGVFAKNIAAAQIARAVGGEAIYLTVDSDTPKTDRLVSPRVSPRGVERIEVPIPGARPAVDFQHQPAATAAEWRAFFSALGTTAANSGSIGLEPFAAAFLESPTTSIDYGDAIERGRIALESAIGITPLRELRVSTLCATPEFAAFFARLVLDAERTAASYNAAQASYRSRHRVRSPGRPVPVLARTGGRIESPFWVSRPDGSRERLFVVHDTGTVSLFADHAPIAAVAAAARNSRFASDLAAAISAAGWLVRPRALSLTAFMRLFVADVFIHGIGGAKYDEITDEWIEDLFGGPPAPMCCVTATLRLPLPRTGATMNDLRQARFEQRDMRFNPQRYVTFIDEDLLRQRGEMIARSELLRSQRSRDRVERRRVHREIQAMNAALLARDAWRPAAIDAAIAEFERKIAVDRIATDREYFVGLHSLRALRELAGQITVRIAPE